MGNLVLMALCFIAGVVLRRTGRLPGSAPSVLNSYVIHVALPAMALLHIHGLEFSPELIYSVGSAWILFGVGYLLFRQAGRIANYSSGTLGALILTGGLGNTSFVGLPMIEVFYGAEFLGVGILIDQLGSFLILSTAGIALAASCSSGKVTASGMIRKVLVFPPFVAMIIAFAMMPLPFPAWAEEVLGRIGGTLAPVALLSVGFQLRLDHIRNNIGPLAVGLSYKLLFGPAIVALLFLVILGARGPLIQVSIFETAMAPMITGSILAAEHDLDPSLSALMVGLGIPLSFLTLPLWWWVLSLV